MIREDRPPERLLASHRLALIAYVSCAHILSGSHDILPDHPRLQRRSLLRLEKEEALIIKFTIKCEQHTYHQLWSELHRYRHYDFLECVYIICVSHAFLGPRDVDRAVR